MENLFSPDSDTAHRKDSTLSGLRKWNQYRYENKIHKLASVFGLVKEEKGQLPFIIGLAEVENDEVIRDLLQNEIMNDYSFVHYESLDERGVDVALLYDNSKVKIEHSEPISFVFKIDNGNPDAFDTTRDVLYCRIRYIQDIFNVFVLHLPSQREKDVNKPKREFILSELGEKIGHLVTDKNEPVIVCGDFNENPDSVLMDNLTFDKHFNKTLTNPFEELYKNNYFSTFHYKNGLLFDQILLSSQFFTPNFLFSFRNATVFNPEKISSWDRKFRGRPYRTYAGTRYLGGYSDHYPVLTEFCLEKQ